VAVLGLVALARHDRFVSPQANGGQKQTKVLELALVRALADTDLVNIFSKDCRLAEDGHAKESDERPKVIERVLDRGPGQTPANVGRDRAHCLELLA